jgi:hypothetical protein
MLIDVAVTVPVVLVLPSAVTHWPTARAEALAEEVWVKVVDESVLTVTFSVGAVVVVVFLVVVEGRTPERSNPWTTKLDPLTEVTEPLAVAKLANAPTLGRVPPLAPPKPG